MGFIKNEYPISEKGEVVFTDKKPRNLEDTLDNVVLGNVLSFIADLLKNGRNSTVYELKSGALVRWDLNIEDMRPSQDKIVVNAKYWLERPGGVPKYSSDFSDVFNFSGLQLTGSELTSGRVKIIAECNNESDFIRKRFDEIWADVLKTFKTSVQPAPDIIKNSKASQIMEFVKQNPDALSGLVLGKTT
ncbi:MAG: hypothetical protein HYR93_00790, partial [Chloroflexi bacterium]|nr:hypothetical protein [Chloroflexota bacterium]